MRNVLHLFLQHLRPVSVTPVFYLHPENLFKDCLMTL